MSEEINFLWPWHRQGTWSLQARWAQLKSHLATWVQHSGEPVQPILGRTLPPVSQHTLWESLTSWIRSHRQEGRGKSSWGISCLVNSGPSWLKQCWEWKTSKHWRILFMAAQVPKCVQGVSLPLAIRQQLSKDFASMEVPLWIKSHAIKSIFKTWLWVLNHKGTYLQILPQVMKNVTNREIVLSADSCYISRLPPSTPSYSWTRYLWNPFRP